MTHLLQETRVSFAELAALLGREKKREADKLKSVGELAEAVAFGDIEIDEAESRCLELGISAAVLASTVNRIGERKKLVRELSDVSEARSESERLQAEIVMNDADASEALRPFRERAAQLREEKQDADRRARPAFHAERRLRETIPDWLAQEIEAARAAANGPQKHREYALAPGSPGECHETGRTYDQFSGPSLTDLTTITAAERAILFRVAALFDDQPKDEGTHSDRVSRPTGDSQPGDEFNQRAEWEGILTPHGWSVDHTSGDKTLWRRPGKATGWSATTGCKSKAGNDLFYCFSTNADPFEDESGYSKFSAYALLNHNGDYSAAAKLLASEGYGDQRSSKQSDRVFDGGDRYVAGHEALGPIPTSPATQEREHIIFSRITSRELAEGNFALEYLVKDTMVAGQPLIIAGPQKTLKTSFIIDLAISLATCGYFLGKLKVNRASRVAVMTGESGLATIQETAIRICQSAGVFLHDIEYLLWSEDLPKFGNAAHLDALERFLTDDGVEVLFIDPAYLTMPGADAANMMIQGELLRTVSELCRRLGVTMVLAHHTKRHTGRDVFSPGELSDIAWSGFAEFARQWLLINRREAYEPGTGDLKLWLSVGGSAGHSALWAVDVTEGVRSDDSERAWDVELSKPAEAQEKSEAAKEAAKESAKHEQQQEDLSKLLKPSRYSRNG